MRAIVGMCLLATMTCCMDGCKRDERATDVSGWTETYPELKRSFVVGATYSTQTRLFVVGSRLHAALEPEGGVMPFFADYGTSPVGHAGIMGVAETGTLVRIKALLRDSGQGSVAAGVTADGIIVGGPFAGVWVDLMSVSEFELGTRLGAMAKPDPKFLKLEGE
jgi:hypothetical protein